MRNYSHVAERQGKGLQNLPRRFESVRDVNKKIMKQPPACPVDFVSVNEYRVRVVAALVFVLAIAYLLIHHWIIPLFMAFDFCMRAFNGGKYSVLQLISGRIERSLPLPRKPTDRGPKRFAASIGFVIALLVLLLALFGFLEFSLYVMGLIVLFSLLEFAIGFCAGCWMYTLLKRSDR